MSGDFFILKNLGISPDDIKGIFPFYQVYIYFSNEEVNV